MTITIKKEAGRKASRKVRFGSVEVKAVAPEPNVIEANIRSGQAALKRARVAFIKPGVSLRLSKNVAKYRADPDQPDVIVREVGGTTERGSFVNGKFERAG